MTLGRFAEKDANGAWYDVLEYVLDEGESVPILCADGQLRNTVELVSQSVVCDMRRPVLTYTKRKLNYRFMAAEAAWILSGSDQVKDIQPFNQAIAKFSNDGLKFSGAYGPKVAGQLDYVVNALLKEPTSRRAVINIWRENPEPSLDTPCTLSLQFIIRQNQLHVISTMRSSDVWLGLPYDLFTFSMIAGTVFLKLRDRGLRLTALGSLINTVGSRHLYENDVKKITELNLIKDPGPTDEVTKKGLFIVENFKNAEELSEHLWAVARGERASLKTEFLEDLKHLQKEEA